MKHSLKSPIVNGLYDLSSMPWEAVFPTNHTGWSFLYYREDDNKNPRVLHDIAIQLLKYADKTSSVPFAHIMNLSVQLVQLQDDLKIGNIISTYKKGNASRNENLRLIVLLRYLSIFAGCQYGYRMHKSTER